MAKSHSNSIRERKGIFCIPFSLFNRVKSLEFSSQPAMPKKKGGKKDSITGMRIGNGLTIFSDTVYAEDSPEMRRIYGENNFTYDTGGKTEIEFEFSKKFIIITSNTTGQLTGNDGIPQTTPDYTIRVAGKGKFKAGKDGILKKGKIKNLKTIIQEIAH